MIHISYRPRVYCPAFAIIYKGEESTMFMVQCQANIVFIFDKRKAIISSWYVTGH